MSRVNALLDTLAPVDSMRRQRLEIAHDFTDGIDELNVRLMTSKRRITAAVKASGTSLTEICGLGPITAVIIIGNTGNIDRFPTKVRFASYNATAPAPVEPVGDRVSASSSSLRKRAGNGFSGFRNVSDRGVEPVSRTIRRLAKTAVESCGWAHRPSRHAQQVDG